MNAAGETPLPSGRPPIEHHFSVKTAVDGALSFLAFSNVHYSLHLGGRRPRSKGGTLHLASAFQQKSAVRGFLSFKYNISIPYFPEKSKPPTP